MTRRRVIYACNAMDDALRLARGISTDSPAATRKVAMACDALRRAGVQPIVLSLGRGRQDGSGRAFGWAVSRRGGVAMVYCPFLHRPLVSELVSFIAPAVVLWRLRRRAGDTSLVLYNRQVSHLALAWIGRLLGYRLVLDLEDGHTARRSFSLSYLKSRLMRIAVDGACDRVLLACSSLGSSTRLKRRMCFYGAADRKPPPTPPAAGSRVEMLIGGTVARDTGAELLIESIRRCRRLRGRPQERFSIHVTGSGDCLEAFRELAREGEEPRICVHGRLSDEAYRRLLERTTVGLALKPNAGAYANTTFPSKVIEIASAGLLVLTTDISDVRLVLGDGAVYLERDDPDLLLERLLWIAGHAHEAFQIRLKGYRTVRERCDPDRLASQLSNFLFAP